MDESSWIDDLRLVVDGHTFVAAAMLAPGDDDDHFVIVKPPELVRRYLELLEREQPRRIVELGVKRGGSTALIALAAKPELLLAIDLESEIPPALARLIAERGIENQLITAFGLDQGDRAALTTFVDSHLPEGGFDLVIDDASHMLGPSRVSFEVLFPRLRPGGLYVVEDWNADWDVATALARLHPDATDLRERFGNVNSIFYDTLNRPDHGVPAEVITRITEAAAATYAADPSRTFLECVASAVDRADIAAEFDVPDAIRRGARRPLADLAIEFTMIRASTPDLIDEVRIDGEWLSVRRGSVELPRDEFRLADCWTDFFGYLT